MKIFSFQTNQTNPLVKKATLELVRFEKQTEELTQLKNERMQRQVELWSVLTPSADLEEEYRKVTADIAYIIKKTLALQEHIKKLRLATFHCKNGHCDNLKQLLTISDPTTEVSPEVPQVHYN